MLPVRAWMLEFNAEVPYIYPYFFLNLDTQGVTGVLKWVGILLLATTMSAVISSE